MSELAQSCIQETHLVSNVIIHVLFCKNWLKGEQLAWLESVFVRCARGAAWGPRAAPRALLPYRSTELRRELGLTARAGRSRLCAAGQRCPSVGASRGRRSQCGPETAPKSALPRAIPFSALEKWQNWIISRSRAEGWVRNRRTPRVPWPRSSRHSATPRARRPGPPHGTQRAAPGASAGGGRVRAELPPGGRAGRCGTARHGSTGGTAALLPPGPARHPSGAAPAAERGRLCRPVRPLRAGPQWMRSLQCYWPWFSLICIRHFSSSGIWCLGTFPSLSGFTAISLCVFSKGFCYERHIKSPLIPHYPTDKITMIMRQKF